MILLFPILMIAFGLILRMGLGLWYGARGPGDDNGIYLLIWGTAWFFVGAGVMVGCLAPIVGWGRMATRFYWHSGSTSAILFLVVMIGVLVCFAVVDTVTSARTHFRRTNAKLLAIASREDRTQQSAELLDEVASGMFVGEAARQLAYELHSGQPFYESVARHRNALPPNAAAFVGIGTLTDATPAAFDQLSRPENAQLQSARRNCFDHSAYAIALIAGMAFMVPFFIFFVLPQFVAMYSEFALNLPGVTNHLISFGSGGSIVWALLSLIVLLLLGAAFIIMAMYLFDIHALKGLTDRLFRSKQIASALRMIALAVEHRADLAKALYALSVTHPAIAVRERLGKAYEDVSKGKAWSAALVTNRLLRPNEQGLVETAEQVGNLPWALRQIAHRRESQLALRLTAATNFFYPLVILALGVVVGFIIIALFAPLVQLIESLS